MKITFASVIFILYLAFTITLQRETKRAKRQLEGLPFDPSAFFPGQFGPSIETPCTTPDGGQGVCKVPSACLFSFDSIEDIQGSTCSLGNIGIGTCCPSQSDGIIPSIPFRIPSLDFPVQVNIPQITGNDLNNAGAAGQAALTSLQALEQELKQLGLVTQRGTSTFMHQAFFGTKSLTQKLGRDGFVGLRASQDLAKTFELDVIQGSNGLSGFSLQDTVASSVCPGVPTCPSTKYRAIDGRCNNLYNPTWGKSFTAFVRLLHPNYADGLDQPRIASDGGPLPSARAVSSLATPDANVPHRTFTLLIMQFAQFLDHDVTLIGLTRARDGSGIVCCREEILRNPRLRHPACFEIAISRTDRFYSRYGETCMEFVRSLPAPRPRCSFGPREQLNQITAFIDASNVYGSTEEEEKELRSFSDGQMKVLRIGNSDLLPTENDQNAECQMSQGNNNFFCFKAGDERVNEQINLALLHTIWMREHNRVARLLAYYNPGWNDEILYQEARRVVGAEMQHIVFNELLPLMLGKPVMEAFDLLLKPSGFSNSYNSQINPGIANSFAAAAYRYGHTLVQGILNLFDKSNTLVDRVPLSNAFFNPELLPLRGNLDSFLRGLVRQPSQKFDSFVSDQLTNHLFQPHGKDFGMDLVALNIQRGRDHGLPGYNAWREHCGLPKAQTFRDLVQWMNPNSAEAFSNLYRNVDDIDLFPAGIPENSLPGATLGPTFACIVADQFRRLKLGDRFWFENGGLESSFTEAQLTEIRKSSLARIICDNSDMFQRMQPLAFLQPRDPWNPLVSCNSTLIPRLNFEQWRNEPVWA
ncbi:chorion peroxidase-like [Limulus polyphemus]|uniref:Chorion peroxidase-like n=1 Tax=Limulus polyphemus TaxID=6850 RepID=A0ABM1BAB9_LIMPO|nr:chorion peroxidase-like [Limulus polyphemus]